MTQKRRPGLVNKSAACHQKVPPARWMQLFFILAFRLSIHETATVLAIPTELLWRSKKWRGTFLRISNPNDDSFLHGNAAEESQDVEKKQRSINK